ncbi:hypothetical protein SLEP1_g22634 [Rubroshorea leprosula]|uniref:Uncharacterized protein n=1 Tax=Rubroshorea leprosula TaxID=152421 RepID=A0AAV5JKQ3_9ROSI|nr:hypothetical protein SLEP1_g22634 [Rubroshorea leprosula]
MASRRVGSKRKQVGSSSTGGQAQEEGNISQSNLFLDTQAFAKVNLGRFIFHSLIKNYSFDMGLPHGALITRLVKRNNIDFESVKHRKIKAGTTLTKASFEKMQVVFRNGSWTKKGDQAMEQQDDEEEGDKIQKWQNKGKKNMKVTAQDLFKLPCKGQTPKPWS